MITIKLQMTKVFADDLLYGLEKSPYGTTVKIESLGGDLYGVELSHTKLEYMMQDCFTAGIYAGLNRMREPSGAPNQEL